MAMSFQGPPPPIPPFWQEPAFWFTFVCVSGAGIAFSVGHDSIRLAAIALAGVSTSSFSYYRMGARQRTEEQTRSALWGRRN